MRKTSLLILFIIAICFARASTRYVKPVATGSGDGSSWLNACDSLQRMINASSAGDAIWVAAGTYKPTNTNDPNISFAMKTGVAIYGGFTGTESLLNQRNYTAHPTILSGDLRENDVIVAGIIANNGENSYHIIKNTIVNSTAVLDGFTLQGGNANSTNGGAIYNGIAAVPTISHCKFLYNMAAVSTGGAVYQYAVGAAYSDCVFTNNSANDGGAFSLADNASATFGNCVFDSNSAASTGGALRVGQNTTVTFSSCSFNSNTSSILGGAVYFNSSTFVFTGCNFTSNSANGDNGGAVYIQHAIIEGDFRSCNFTSNLSVGHGGAIYGEGAELNINNSHFDGNVAQGSGTLGGAICNKYNGVDYSALFLKVCSFTNNTSDGSGGAVYTDGGDFSADNCIFYNNTASTNGGALRLQSANPEKITNSTFANNTAPNGSSIAKLLGTASVFNSIMWDNNPIYNQATLSISYSDVRGGYAGTGNINSDPLFINASNPIGTDNIWGTADDGLQLRSCSPAVNTGANSLVASGTSTDFSGVVRVQLTTVDMGAYEKAKATQFIQSLNICGSGSVTVGTHTYTTAGVYTDTLYGASSDGCDSVVITSISITQVPPAPSPVANFTVNNGDTVNAINFSVANDSLYAQWRGSSDSAGIGKRGARTLPAFRAVNNGNTPLIDTITVSARFRGYAYIAADSAIIKFSLVQRRFVDTIYLPNGGSGAIQVLKSPTSNVAYILSYGFAPGLGHTAKCIYVLDLGTDQIIRTINYTYTAINRAQSDPASYAGTMTISPDGTTLYIVGNTSYQQGFSLVKLDISTGTAISFAPTGAFEDAGHSICITPDGRYLYIARYRGGPLKVDATTMTEVSTPAFSGAVSTTQLAISPNGQTLYATSSFDHLFVINTATDSILTTINNITSLTGSVGQGMSFTPDSNYLVLMMGNPSNHDLKVYKLNVATNVLTQIQTNSGEPFDYHDGTPFPNVSMTPDGREYYMHYMDFVFFKGVSYSGGVSGNYGGAPALGQTLGFGSVGDMMIPGQCTSPETSFTITINPTVRYSQSIAICQGQSLTIAGHIHTVTGTYIDTLTGGSVYGTDSIVTTQLTIHNPVTSTINTSICAGDDYAGHTSTGTFVDHYNTTYGCDSTRTLNLTIIPNVATTIDASVCQGSGYAGHNATGIYIDHYTSAAGCDSARTLNLTVIPNVTSTIVTTICAGGIYAGHATSGIYVDHYNNAGGCDSTRTLNLTVYLPDTSSTSINICSNQVPYNWNGQDYSATGNYTAHVTGAHGCDSVARLILIINNVTTWWRDADGDGDGNQFIDSFSCSQPIGYVANSDDCNDNDAAVSSHLTWYIDLDNDGYGDINQVYHGCDPGGPFHFVLNSTDCDDNDASVHARYNFYVDNDGDGFGSQTVANVCAANAGTPPSGYATNSIDCNDALFNTSSPGSTSSTNNLSICQSQIPYVWNGLTFTGAGSQTATGFTNAAGCDSSATLNLTVTPAITSTVNQTICQGANFEGYSATGTFVDHFTSVGGCDSARTLNLTVTPNVTSTVNQTICQGSSFEGYSSTGTFVDHFTSVGGCDSARTLNLTVTPNVTSTVNQTICQGSSFEGHNTTGTFVDHFTSVGGCDSARTLNLAVTPNITSTVNQTICQGSSFEGYASTGTYVDHFTSIGGCDSGRTLNLIVTPNLTSTVNQTICQGSSFEGHNTAGTFVDHFTSVGGCDSARTLNLAVTPNITSTVNQTICQGSSFEGYASTGTYVDHFTSIGGCDSGRTLNLIVTPNLTSTVNQTICQGSSFEGHNTTGTFVDHFTSVGGCDSARTLNLTVTPNLTSTINQTICQGSSFEGYSANGTYTDHYTSVGGCDSARTLNLTVTPNVTSTVNQTICQGSSFEGYSSTGTFVDHFTSVGGCDSARTLNLTITPNLTSTVNQTICQGSNFESYSSTGTYVDHFISISGCDSVRTLDLIVLPTISATQTISACRSVTIGSHTYTASGLYVDTLTAGSGCDSILTTTLIIHDIETVELRDTICFGDAYTFGGQTLTASGVYADTITTMLGCDSITRLYLTINLLPTPVLGRINDTIATQYYAGYQWFVNGIAISGANSQRLVISQNGDYSVLVTDAKGCSDTSSSISITGLDIKDVSNSFVINLYPNPTAGTLVIAHNYPGSLHVQVISSLGNHVKDFMLNDTVGYFDISELASGVYQVVITDNKQMIKVLKVVKE